MAAGDDDVGDRGQLLEISLNDRQQLLRAVTQMQVPLQQGQQTRQVDSRIMDIGDFRSADCRSVSQDCCAVWLHRRLQIPAANPGLWKARVAWSGGQAPRGMTLSAQCCY